MARPAWYRLDNVGKFYAAQAGHSAQTVFRIAAEMTEPVDPCILQRALNATMAAFPGFNVMLRSGFFWHYLEQSTDVLKVQPEYLPICFGLHVDHSSILTRVSFYRNRINVEVSHMISDGRGTLEFFKTLVGNYAAIRYDAEDAVEPYLGTKEEKTEDSFAKNYEKRASAKDPSEKPYRLRGWKDQAAPTYMEYHVDADEMKRVAKTAGVSVTSLLIAAVICAIERSMPASDRARGRPIRMDVPVDLRRHFDSSTLRNFFGLAFVSYTASVADSPLADVAERVQAQITSATAAPALKRRMNRMIKLEKNMLLRWAPLVLKDAVLGIAARIAARDVTTTVSSLGVIRLPESVEPYVSGISVLTSTTGLNFVACTYANDMTVGISTVYERHNIVRNFVNVLGEVGIHGTMDISKTAEEVDTQLKRAALEEMVLGIAAPQVVEGTGVASKGGAHGAAAIDGVADAPKGEQS